METFSALLAFWTGEFPSQRPVMQSFDVSFDLCLNKQVSKQSWGWWTETQSSSLWRQCNAGPHLYTKTTFPVIGIPIIRLRQLYEHPISIRVCWRLKFLAEIPCYTPTCECLRLLTQLVWKIRKNWYNLSTKCSIRIRWLANKTSEVSIASYKCHD